MRTAGLSIYRMYVSWHSVAGDDSVTALWQGKSSKSFEFGASPTSLATADETASITKALPSALTIHIDHGKVRQ